MRRRLPARIRGWAAISLIVLAAGCQSGSEQQGDKLDPAAATPTADSSDSPAASLRPGAGRGHRPPGKPGRRTSSPSASAPAPGDPRPASDPGGRWRPAPGTQWQWQLTTPIDQSVNVPVYDIDGFENSAAVVKALHDRGRKVICYVNVGSVEEYRPDHGAFPSSVQGQENGWPQEKWLDIRRADILRPIMAKRFDMCRAKGFDAVEPDLVEGYSNDTGFPLTAADQLTYNRMIADLAHDRGLSVALKNDVDQVNDLVNDFDFSIDEECAQFKECDGLTPFIKQGKAVFHVEYKLTNNQFCSTTERLKFSSMRKNLDLDAARWPC